MEGQGRIELLERELAAVKQGLTLRIQDLEGFIREKARTQQTTMHDLREELTAEKEAHARSLDLLQLSRQDVTKLQEDIQTVEGFHVATLRQLELANDTVQTYGERMEALRRIMREKEDLMEAMKQEKTSLSLELDDETMTRNDEFEANFAEKDRLRVKYDENILQVVKVLAAETQDMPIVMSDLTILLDHLNLRAEDFSQSGNGERPKVQPFADFFVPHHQRPKITLADVVYLSLRSIEDQKPILPSLMQLQMEGLSEKPTTMLYVPFVFEGLRKVVKASLTSRSNPLEASLAISMLTQLFTIVTPSKNVTLQIVKDIVGHARTGSPVGGLINISIYRLIAVAKGLYPSCLGLLPDAGEQARVAEIGEMLDTERLPDLLARAFLDKPGDSRCFEMQSTTSPARLFLFRDTPPSMASELRMAFIQREDGKNVLYRGSLDMDFTHQRHEWIITLRISDGEVFGRVESVKLWEFLGFWDQRRSDDMKRLFLRAYYYERDDKSVTGDDDDDDDDDDDVI